MEIWPLCYGVHPCFDDVTYRPCANFKSKVAGASKEIPNDFRGLNAFSWNMFNDIVKALLV